MDAKAVAIQSRDRRSRAADDPNNLRSQSRQRRPLSRNKEFLDQVFRGRSLRTRSVHGMWWVLPAVLAVVSATPGQASDRWETLGDRCQLQNHTFRPIDPQSTADMLSAARDCLNRAEEHLRTKPAAEQAAWRKKLRIEQLSRALSVSRPDLDRAGRFAAPLFATDVGLEVPAFVDLRRALDPLQQRLRIVQSAGLAEAEFKQRLVALERLLSTAGNHPDTLAIGAHLDWLSAAGQASELVETVADAFQLPNVMLEVSRSVVESRLMGISQDVDETEFVSMMIQGAHVSGEARFQAQVTPKLADDAERAEIELRISGEVTAPNNVAVRRPVVIYTSSTADVEATTRVYWDGRKLVAKPTSVTADTRSQIHNAELLRRSGRNRRWLNSSGGLISRLAISRAESQKSLAEYDASRRMEKRIGEQIDEYVDEKLSAWNEQMSQSLINPLTRWGDFPNLQARARDDRLILEVTRFGAGGLAAADAPSWPPIEGILALSIHETALPSFVTPSAAGARWTDQRFAEIQKQLLGVNSYEFRLGLHPRWEVVLDSQRPVATRIGQNGVRFEFNVTEWVLAGTRYAYPFRVAAQYRLEPTTTVLRLERQGPVELIWTGGPTEHPSAPEESRLGQFLRDTFSGFFLAEAYADGLQTPAGGDWAAASQLQLSRVELQPGWLRMTFGRQVEVFTSSSEQLR